jgi:hypothetical protein
MRLLLIENISKTPVVSDSASTNVCTFMGVLVIRRVRFPPLSLSRGDTHSFAFPLSRTRATRDESFVDVPQPTGDTVARYARAVATLV